MSGRDRSLSRRDDRRNGDYGRNKYYDDPRDRRRQGEGDGRVRSDRYDSRRNERNNQDVGQGFLIRGAAKRTDSYRPSAMSPPPLRPYQRDRELFPSHARDRRYDNRLSRNDDYPSYQDRTRERGHSRERSPVRDSRGTRDVRDGRDSRDSRAYNGGERARDDRYYRGDSRERNRPRRSDSVESRRYRQREDSRDRRHPKDVEVRPSLPHPASRNVLTIQAERAAAAAAQAEAEKQEQEKKRARLAIWKANKLEANRIAAEAKAVSRPTSSGTDSQPANAASPGTNREGSSPIAEDSAKPYAGKFDPKAIAKKAAAASSKLKAATLEGDISGKNKSAAPVSNGLQAANNSKKPIINGSVGKDLEDAETLRVSFTNFCTGGSLSSTKSASRAIQAGFGLSKTKTEDTIDSGPNVDMDDEEIAMRSIEKLPHELSETFEDAALANAEEQDDADLDGDVGDDEDQDFAARAAAEKRAAMVAADAEPMEDVQPTVQTTTHAGDAMQVDEDIDPLDAYMNEIAGPPAAKAAPKLRKSGKLTEPQAMFGDEDGISETEKPAGDFDELMSLAIAKKKRKEITQVDHDMVNYEEFRKDFYSEPIELREMDDEDVKSLRFELDGIQVQGADVPKPVQKFAQFGLGSQTLDIIRRLGFEKPTSIQAQAIPAIMSGRDTMAVAKTGSGKTVAFLLPMFRHIKDQRPLDNMGGPISLIMAPTRELATQIHKECKPYLTANNLRAVCAYGGAPISDQIAELKRGAEIVVCTPGRFIDLLTANQGRVINLRRVTYVVLDEADRMFDMGFEPQITKILQNVRPDRQTVLFSATFSSKMEKLARKALTKPVQIVVGGRSTVAPEITQLIEVRLENKKWRRTLELLGQLFNGEDGETARALIFVDRQDAADEMLIELQKLGYPCVSIHGGREQVDRDQAISDFKAGLIPIMIATSVAARGLDVKELKLVINFDVPNHLEDYVHRVGRTGRAGNTGTAVTYITPEQQRYSYDLVKALEQSDQPVPEELRTLSNEFWTLLKAGQVEKIGSGFGGRGLDKLDNLRVADKKKTYRNEAGELVEIEEEAEEEKKDEEKDGKNGADASKPQKSEVKARDAPAALPAAPSVVPMRTAPTLNPALAKVVQSLEAQTIVHKRDDHQPVRSNGVARGGARASSRAGGPVKDDEQARLEKKERARIAAANVTARVGGGAGQTRSGIPIDNKGPDAGAFHSTLEVNDIPQSARWAVTNRSNVAKVLEQTGVSITTKGQHYAPGKEPGPGQLPKMYILVEADTEIQVQDAMADLKRRLHEGTLKAQEEEARAPASSGRYSVV